jgi:hypothetical protein
VNRPAAANALEADEDHAVRVVVIAANGRNPCRPATEIVQFS